MGVSVPEEERVGDAEGVCVMVGVTDRDVPTDGVAVPVAEPVTVTVGVMVGVRVPEKLALLEGRPEGAKLALGARLGA